MPQPKEPTYDENTANQTTGAHTRVLIRLHVQLWKGIKFQRLTDLTKLQGKRTCQSEEFSVYDSNYFQKT